MNQRHVPDSGNEANPDFAYLDANFYLDYLTEDRPYHDTLRAIVEAWRKGEVRLATSALTLTEVLWMRRMPGAPLQKMDQQMESRIDDLFRNPHRGQPLRVVPVTDAIARRSRRLVWYENIEPKDAIHIRTALELKVPVMFTSDRKLLGRDVGGNPPLRIEEPKWNRPPQPLPDQQVGSASA